MKQWVKSQDEEGLEAGCPLCRGTLFNDYITGIKVAGSNRGVFLDTTCDIMFLRDERGAVSRTTIPSNIDSLCDSIIGFVGQDSIVRFERAAYHRDSVLYWSIARVSNHTKFRDVVRVYTSERYTNDRQRAVLVNDLKRRLPSQQFFVYVVTTQTRALASDLVARDFSVEEHGRSRRCHG